VTFESAYPEAPAELTKNSHRGINGTQWVIIDKPTFDGCIDPNDYR
jgi:hypothetical protein